MRNFEKALEQAVDHGAGDVVQEGAMPSMDLLSAAVYADVLYDVAHRPMGGSLSVEPLIGDAVPAMGGVRDHGFDDGDGPSDVSVVEQYLSFDQRDDTFDAIMGEAQDPFAPPPEPQPPQRTAQEIVREMLRSL